METGLNAVQANIKAEANEWFIRIREGDLSDQELNAWRCWLGQSTDHEMAFQEVEVLWRDLDQLENIPLPATAALATDTYNGENSIGQWQCERQSSSSVMLEPGNAVHYLLSGLRKAYSSWVMAVIVSVGVAALVLFVLMPAPVPSLLPSAGVESFQTAKAKHRTINLADGSVIELGAQSILTVRFSEEYRDVNLVQGEAFFQVATDKYRPFTVQMGNGFARVVGTAFNIDRDGRGSTVTVLEGKVRVAVQRQTLDSVNTTTTTTTATHSNAMVQLTVGEQVIVDDGGTLGKVNQVNAKSAVAWREGILAFSKQPMRDVVSELNRYSEQHIILANVSLDTTEFTGTVDKAHIEEWLQGLEKAYPIRVSIIDSKTILLFDKTR